MALYKLFLCVACFLFLFGQCASQRLIQFSETHKVWLNQSEVDRLVFSPGVHQFMDVTEFDGVYSSMGGVRADPTPIPTSPIHQAYVKGSLFPQADIKNIIESITQLSEFYTRYYKSPTGTEAGRWIQQRFDQLALAGESVAVKNFTNSFPQVSVIATIPGSGPNKNSRINSGFIQNP
jgi:leucyl aminopeptidase